MPMTPDQMRDAVIRNLPAKTGKSLEEWVAITRTRGELPFKQVVQWLKQEHGLGHVQAQMIAWEAQRPADYVPKTDADLIAAQYAGEKAALRPIYERLAAMARAMGGELDARNTYVSLVRDRQFGVIQPSTRTRIDLFLRLPGVEPAGRLQPAGSGGSGSVTHKISLTSPEQCDAEVQGWLAQAFAAAVKK